MYINVLRPRDFFQMPIPIYNFTLWKNTLYFQAFMLLDQYVNSYKCLKLRTAGWRSVAMYFYNVLLDFLPLL